MYYQLIVHYEIRMDSFTVRDLREKPGAIIREAEQGHLSVVTKRGHPVFLAVPFQEDLFKLGLDKNLSILMLQEKCITLRQAAKLAHLSLEEMLTLVTAFDIPTVNYDTKELDEEVNLVL